MLTEITAKNELDKIQYSLKDYRDKLLSDLEVEGLIINFKNNKIELGLSARANPSGMYVNYGNYLKNAEKYIFVDKEIQSSARYALEIMNITDESLFTGLDGLAKSMTLRKIRKNV